MGARMEQHKVTRVAGHLFLAGAVVTTVVSIALYLSGKAANAPYAVAAAFLFLVLRFLIDATEKARRTKLSLRREQIYRHAITQNRILVFQYEPATHAARLIGGGGNVTLKPAYTDVPYALVADGTVARESAAALSALFEQMDGGAVSGMCFARLRPEGGDYVWQEVRFTRDPAIMDTVVLSLLDVTEEMGRKLALERWRQTVESMPPERILYLEYDLNADRTVRSIGTLLGGNEYADLTLDVRTHRFVSAFVHVDDADAVKRTLDRDRLRMLLRRGIRSDQTEFRKQEMGGPFTWVRLSVQLCGGDDGEVTAYLLFEDIDEEKRQSLALEEQKDMDELTHVLRSEVLKRRAVRLFGTSESGASHALLLVDIDRFHVINDECGHEAGDAVLRGVAAGLRSELHPGELIGRAGGNLFAILLTNIPYRALLEQRAARFLHAVAREYDGIAVTASIGISLYPHDGADYAALYRRADLALKEAQRTGSGLYAMFLPRMDPTGDLTADGAQSSAFRFRPAVLLVDGDAARRERVSALLARHYRVPEAENGMDAVRFLRESGAELSALLVRETLPDRTAGELLRDMRTNRSLSSVAAIVIGDEAGSEGALYALSCGAADYCAADEGGDELLLRVQAAVSRSENERLRAQNSYLMLQGEEEARYRSVIRSTGTVVFDYDCVNDRFHYDMQAQQYLAGHYDKRMLWQILREDGVAADADAARMRALVLETAERSNPPQATMDVPLRSAGGDMRWFRMRAVRMEDGYLGAGRVLITLNDVQEETAATEKLRELAENDSLTGLMNRACFVGTVERLLAAAPPNSYVMAYFDVDRFKAINDRFGHAEGDRFLRAIAARLRESVGDRGVCCRISADFFAFCTMYDDGQLRRVERAVEEFRRDVATDARMPFEITFSFGLYVVDDPTLPVDAILDRAAMAQASVKGSYLRWYAYYDESFRERLLSEQAIESHMNAALAEGQFDIYLQPQISLAGGNVVGAEALVRWIKPDGEVVAPGAFVPLFERNGFITKLDAYIWERACATLHGWIAGGMPCVPIAVNISRVDMADPSLIDTLDALVKRYALSPSMLKLEITESVYSEKMQQMVDVVHRMQALGFTVEMDDFGSGYSSLNTLKDVPVNAVKLDMRFLAGGGLNGRGGTIVNAVVRMAKWLQLPVTAEGVETPQQAAYLKSIGCDNAQGFLYARPMPVPAFEKMLAGNSVGDPYAARNVLEMRDANAFWTPESLETLIFNSYVGGAAIVERDGDKVEILRANDRYVAMMQLSSEQFERIRLEPLSVMDAADRAAYLDAMDRAAQTHAEVACVTKRINASAKDVYLRSRLQCIASGDGRKIFYVSIEDVTAQRLAEINLLASQRTLFAATQHARLYYWVYDMQQNTSLQGELSQEALAFPQLMYDYPEAFLRTGYIHPDHVPLYRKLHEDLKNGAREVSADILCRWQDGYEWRKVKYSVLEEENGEVAKAIGTSESLSAYKELENRLLTAAKQSGIMTWVYEIANHRILQDSVDENGGKVTVTIDDVPESLIRRGEVCPDDADAFRALYRTVDRGEKYAECTVRFRANKLFGEGREWVWQRVVYSVNIDQDGRAETAIGTAVDTTEHVAMQARFREAVANFHQLDRTRYISVEYVNLHTRTIAGQSAERPYEARREEVLSRIPDEAMRADIRRISDPEYMLAQYRNGIPQMQAEYRIRTSAGPVCWLHTNIRLLLNPDTREMIAFFVTEKVDAKKNMAYAFEHLMQVGYDYVSDVDVDRDAYTLYLRSDSADMLPYRMEDTYSTTVRKHIDEDVAPFYRAYCERQLPAAHMRERLKQEGEFTLTYAMRDANGTETMKRLLVFALDPEYQHICVARIDLSRGEEKH